MNISDRRVFLLPGEYYVSRTPVEIATLLGSCVAVCLWHKTRHYGAMNHYLLPTASGTVSEDEKGRYGDTAIERIFWLMEKLDPDLSQLEAQVYGGGAVVGHLDVSGNIGERNIDMARTKLRERHIRVVRHKVGGKNGMRVYLDTRTGQVDLKMVQRTAEVERLAERRRDLSSRNIRVLIVDDSPLVRKILRSVIESTPGLEVCGEAGDAFEARDLILSEDPDVISLDIIMPKLDGLQFLKKLSQHYPKPVVICSTIAKSNSDIAARAIEYGAVDVIDKDSLRLYEGMEQVRSMLVPKLRRAVTVALRPKTS